MKSLLVLGFLVIFVRSQLDGCEFFCTCDGSSVLCVDIDYLPSFEIGGLIETIIIVDSSLTSLYVSRETFPSLQRITLQNTPAVSCDDVLAIESEGIIVEIDLVCVNDNQTPTPAVSYDDNTEPDYSTMHSSYSIDELFQNTNNTTNQSSVTTTTNTAMVSEPIMTTVSSDLPLTENHSETTISQATVSQHTDEATSFVSQAIDTGILVSTEQTDYFTSTAVHSEENSTFQSTDSSSENLERTITIVIVILRHNFTADHWHNCCSSILPYKGKSRRGGAYRTRTSSVQLH